MIHAANHVLSIGGGRGVQVVQLQHVFASGIEYCRWKVQVIKVRDGRQRRRI